MNTSDTGDRDLDPAHQTGKILLVKLTSTITISVLYGIFVLLFIVSTYNALHRPAKSRAIWAMFVATVISFLLATVHWAADISIVVLYIRAQLVSPGDRIRAEGTMLLLGQVGNWIVLVLQIINDSIVAWRAWVLCIGCRRWLMIGPLVLLSGTIGCACALIGTIAPRSSYVAFLSSAHGPLYTLVYVAVGLSIASNIFSTLLIGERLWVSRKAWGYGAGSRWSDAEKILLMLVECGAFYAALQIFTVFFIKNSPDSVTPMGFAVTGFWQGYIQITAMFPTSIMILAHRKAIADEQHFHGDE